MIDFILGLLVGAGLMLAVILFVVLVAASAAPKLHD